MELQIIQPKQTLQLQPVNKPLEVETIMNNIIPSYEIKPFIEANTKEVTLEHLRNDCIIPVFSKDNEKTIAHQEFIEVVLDCVKKVFPHHIISAPEMRISHQIKGRIPSAIHKNVKELLDHEKTIYYERMAFIIRVPSIIENINGNDVALTIGGVRAYNQENLYNRKSYEKFKLFIGFQNMVCCNLCVSSDGFVDDLRVSNTNELAVKVTEVLQSYNAIKHLAVMRELSQSVLTEQQFAQLIGKARLYHYLPKEEKTQIPYLMLNDGQISTVAKDFYQDKSFCRDESGNINLWNVYNLFTGANKSSYIDTFLDRNANAFEFTQGLAKAINDGNNYHWFLS
ncbi:DUF3871 family protein [Pseudofulvibacter geojedonensis]|uniref:DUF3871 family protein n=1 Tax=Pseudofulvibacter geojedonensis TaxID=1123758 RepID=A0ABW3I3F3_9FLAO